MNISPLVSGIFQKMIERSLGRGLTSGEQITLGALIGGPISAGGGLKDVPTGIATMLNRITEWSGLFWPNFSLLRYWFCLIPANEVPCYLAQGICSLYRGKDRAF